MLAIHQEIRARGESSIKLCVRVQVTAGSCLIRRHFSLRRRWFIDTQQQRQQQQQQPNHLKMGSRWPNRSATSRVGSVWDVSSHLIWLFRCTQKTLTVIGRYSESMRIRRISIPPPPKKNRLTDEYFCEICGMLIEFFPICWIWSHVRVATEYPKGRDIYKRIRAVY